MLNFTTDFSASIEMIKWFLSLFMLMWHITLIDFHILNHPFDPGKNSTRSWCMNFFICCWIWVCLFVENVCIYIHQILACNFLVMCLSGFAIRVISFFIECLVPSSSIFWKSLGRTSMLFFFNIYLNIPVKTFQPGLLFVKSFLFCFITKFTSLLLIGLFKSSLQYWWALCF